MEQFFKHFGAAGLALITVLFCIYVIFGGFAAPESSIDSLGDESNATITLKDQYGKIDDDYAKVEHTEDLHGKEAVLSKAMESAPESKYYNLDGIYTNKEYKINELFTAINGNSDEVLPAQVIKVSYILNDESSAIVRRLTQNNDKLEVYNGHDDTQLKKMNDGQEVYIIDALSYGICSINEKGTDKTIYDGNDYTDDTIEFKFKGEYIVSVYMQGNKRVTRQYDIHVLKTPSINQ